MSELVEGPLDVIQLHQAGFTNAVACLGTSVSPLQLLIALDGEAPAKLPPSGC